MPRTMILLFLCLVTVEIVNGKIGDSLLLELNNFPLIRGGFLISFYC